MANEINCWSGFSMKCFLGRLKDKIDEMKFNLWLNNVMEHKRVL